MRLLFQLRVSPAILTGLCGLASMPAVGQASFNEVSQSSGWTAHEVPVLGFGSGIAAADFDDDGSVDLFVPTADGVPDRLYRNLGNGQFQDVAASVGLAGNAPGRAALWFDYDADHRLDLVIASDCYNRDCQGFGSFLRLYRQTESGQFLDVTVQSGLADFVHTDEEHRGGMAAGDLNGDGLLDLVTSFWMGTLTLHLNQGDGTFSDVSVASGLGSSLLGHHQVVILDFDGDGRQDIYSAIDFTENRLFLNQANAAGDPSAGVPGFVDKCSTWNCDNAMNDMGVAVGDIDEDGDPDIYVSNIYIDGKHNILQRNDLSADQGFAEISMAAGVAEGGWGWGTTFLDVDNDGFLDLAETNGWRRSPWDSSPMRLFMNTGVSPPVFTEQAVSAGLTDTSWGNSLLAFDYDRDGDLDLIQSLRQGGLDLYQNQHNAMESGRHYLAIRPRMQGANARAIGARITVEVGNRRMTRWVTAGTSYLGQEPAEAFFGLGTAASADRVTVRWPGGHETRLTDVPADQVRTVVHPSLLEDGFELGAFIRWSTALLE